MRNEKWTLRLRRKAHCRLVKKLGRASDQVTKKSGPPKKEIRSCWSERGDSNARPLRPERSALPTALLSDCAAKVRVFADSTKCFCGFFSRTAFWKPFFGDGVWGSGEALSATPSPSSTVLPLRLRPPWGWRGRWSAGECCGGP